MARSPAYATGVAATLVLLVGCGLGTSTSSSSPSESIPERTIRIEGTVTSQETGLPIAGAQVQVMTRGGSNALCIPVRQHLGTALRALPGLGMIVAWGPSCPFSVAAQADELGRFSIRQDVRQTTPPGACVDGYVLVADAPGHDPRMVEPPVFQCTGAVQTVDFALVPNGAPILMSPQPGALIDQNVGDLSCDNPTIAGNGFRIRFEWLGTRDPLEGPYRIRFRHAPTGRTLIDELVTGSELEFASCDFVTDDELGGWEWTVRVEAEGEIGTWETPRSLHFQPCRLSDGSVCRWEDGGGATGGSGSGDNRSVVADAPELVGPAAGASIAQNVGLSSCTPGSPYGSGFRIEFDWSDSGSASTTYHLYVRNRTARYPMVDRLVLGSEWSEASCGFIADHNLQGWYWRVRVESGGVVGDWSEERPFEFEPCRLDGGMRCNAPPDDSESSISPTGHQARGGAS